MKKMFLSTVSAVAAMLMLAACGQTATSSASSSAASASESMSASAPAVERATIRIAGMKGPTSMGMVKMMDEAEAGTARHDYEMEVLGAADEVTARLTSGELDAAAVPANVASTLYNKTGGKLQVAAINTLGVLYVLESGDSIQSVADLKGKTIYSTGKGSTPEFVLNYILSENGINPETDITIEYKSEATEVAAMLQNDMGGIAVLPQPYVTAVQMQNENVRVALSLTDEWDKVSEDSALVTGVLVVRTEFAEQNKAAVAEMLEDYKASIEWVNDNTEAAGELVAKYGIVEKAPMAVKALPECNIVYIDGADMKTMLTGYLQVLFDQKPESVGGAMPDDAFYYGA